MAKKNLERGLIKGYLANRDEALRIAQEWFLLDAEVVFGIFKPVNKPQKACRQR